MTQETLSSVTLATIENYRQVANRATRAYRLGSQRLIVALNNGLEKNLDSRTQRIAPQITDTVKAARTRVGHLVVKGIDGATRRTEQVVDTGSDLAAQQVKKAANFAAGVTNPVLVNGLQAAARLSLPGVKLAMNVSGKLAEGADSLVAAARGKGAAAAVDGVIDGVKRGAQHARRQGAAVSRKAAQTARAGAAAPRKLMARAKRKLA